MKRIIIRCPYCNALAVKRPASAVHGANTSDPTAYLYVCPRYPACDAYVSAHKKSGLPMGTLANAQLRQKRMEAHRSLNRLWEERYMDRKQAYRWLQSELGVPSDLAHIAMFSEGMCDRVIQVCSDF